MSDLMGCSGSAATIVVGTYSFASGGRLIVDWDGSADSDGDGVGNELEGQIAGMSASNPDSDGDGIRDGDELRGKENSQDALNPMLLPAWGADPTVKDLFVEIDYADAAAQFGAAQVPAAVAALWGPTTGTAQPAADERVRLHADIGVVNPATSITDPSLTQWGSWGGTGLRTPSGNPCAATSLLPGRQGLFHLAISESGTAGNAGTGDCVWVSKSGATLAHELGHNMTLIHQGSQLTGYINGKANYTGIMNYAYSFSLPSLSSASWRNVNLNPATMSETGWKGTNTSADASILSGLGYLVSGNSVDWDRDGIHQTSAVRARVTVTEETGRMFDDGYPSGLGNWTTDPVLAWYAAPSGARTYIGFRQSTDNGATYKPAVRWASNIQSGCSAVAFALPTNPDAATCTAWQAVESVTNAVNTTRPFGMADYVTGGVRKLMIIYANTSDQMQSQILTVTAAGGVGTWTNPVAVPTGTVSGAPTAMYDSTANRIELYAPHAGVLKRWSFNVATSTWDIVAVVATWTGTATSVPATIGAGLTWGYKEGDTAPSLFGAIPGASAGVNGSTLQFARRKTSANNEWEALTAPGKITDSRPGIAYVPFTVGNTAINVLNIGRFYILHNEFKYILTQNGVNYQIRRPELNMTQGNKGTCSGTAGRLLCSWTGGKEYYGSYDQQATKFSAALLYDPARDTNLRGAFSTFAGSTLGVWFQPFADGIPNFNAFRDMNDFNFVKKNIACSFNTSTCKGCTAVSSTTGSCTAWTP